jgi:hypothetical protein
MKAISAFIHPSVMWSAAHAKGGLEERSRRPRAPSPMQQEPDEITSGVALKAVWSAATRVRKHPQDAGHNHIASGNFNDNKNSHVIPTAVKRASAFFSLRVGRRDLALSSRRRPL